VSKRVRMVWYYFTIESELLGHDKNKITESNTKKTTCKGMTGPSWVWVVMELGRREFGPSWFNS